MENELQIEPEWNNSPDHDDCVMLGLRNPIAITSSSQVQFGDQNESQCTQINI